MKKSAIVATIGLLLPAVPTTAATIFKSTLHVCGSPHTVGGCGSNAATTDLPFLTGTVTVDVSGAVNVELSGASPSTTYTVYVGNWYSGPVTWRPPDGQDWFPQVVGDGYCYPGDGSIGTITTDVNGSFAGPVATRNGTPFAFPEGAAITQLNIAFNNPTCWPTKFTTGIDVR